MRNRLTKQTKSPRCIKKKNTASSLSHVRLNVENPFILNKRRDKCFTLSPILDQVFLEFMLYLPYSIEPETIADHRMKTRIEKEKRRRKKAARKNVQTKIGTNRNTQQNKVRILYKNKLVPGSRDLKGSSLRHKWKKKKKEESTGW
jgi:hypothetical protein